MKISPQAETCRAHALKCWDAAKRATHKRARDQFLDLAQHWEGMAHDIENIQALRLSLEMKAAQRIAANIAKLPELLR